MVKRKEKYLSEVGWYNTQRKKTKLLPGSCSALTSNIEWSLPFGGSRHYHYNGAQVVCFLSRKPMGNMVPDNRWYVCLQQQQHQKEDSSKPSQMDNIHTVCVPLSVIIDTHIKRVCVCGWMDGWRDKVSRVPVDDGSSRQRPCVSLNSE